MTARLSKHDDRAAVNEGGLRPNFREGEAVFKLRDRVSGRVIERMGGDAKEMERLGAYEIVSWDTPSCFELLTVLTIDQLRAVYDSATRPLSGRGACHRECDKQRELALSLLPYAEAGVVSLEVVHA